MAEPQPRPREWEPERYRAGDERDMLALFKLVFGHERPLEHWTWQFARNPYGGPYATLARRRSDHLLVGQHVVMLFQLNVRGTPVRACHSLDLAVHPDYRGQRIFDITARDCFEWCHGDGIEFVVAFPNASSYPGFVRTLGWNRILEPRLYALRLGLSALPGALARVPGLGAALDIVVRAPRRLGLALRRLTLASRAGDVTLAESATVPNGHDALWDACRTQETLSLWKDAEYLRWRYDANPNHAFTYLTLARAGELVALAVVVEVGKVTTICELLVRDHDVTLGRLLVCHASLRALRRGQDKLRFLGSDVRLFDQAFEGFATRVASENVFVGRAFDDAELNALGRDAANWTVTFGDGDFV